MSKHDALRKEYDETVAEIDANYDLLMKQQAADNDGKMELYAKQRDTQREALDKRYGFVEIETERPESEVELPSDHLAAQ